MQKIDIHINKYKTIMFTTTTNVDNLNFFSYFTRSRRIKQQISGCKQSHILLHLPVLFVIAHLQAHFYHQFTHTMKPSKRNPIDSNVLGHAKKPRLVSVQQFRCGNGLCNRPFKNERGLKSHYRNSIICAMRASSASASSSIGGLKNVSNTCVAIASSTLASSECSEATEESDSVVESEASPIFFPWDDESSIDESDHADNLIQYEDIVETQFGNLNDFVDCNNPSNSQSIVPPASIVRPPISFHTHSFMETKLLKLLNDVNAPHSLYQNVMNWASEAKKDGYEFRSGRTTRAAQVKHLEKWLGLKYCRPETKMLCLPGDMLFVPVTSFDFKSVLFSLLSNPKLVGDITKLDVNQDDPFARYVAKDGLLSCVNSGQFYNDAYDNMIKDPSKELLILIIMCSDETMLSKGGKAGAWPMMFTLGIFGQLLRNTAASYGPLGYLYDLSIVNSKEERKNMDIDLKYKRLHAIMGRVLESYIKTTKNDELKDIPMQLDKFHKTVTIKCPTVFIIGDMVGKEKYVGLRRFQLFVWLNIYIHLYYRGRQVVLLFSNIQQYLKPNVSQVQCAGIGVW